MAATPDNEAEKVDQTGSDLPTDVTESYGTGVEPQPGWNIGGRTMQEDNSEYNAVDPTLSGGDVDAAWDQAEVAGEETVGGTAPTPDQNVVDDLGEAMGTDMRDRQDFYGNDQLNVRDENRWQLDPQSSEDYPDRPD